MYKLYGDYKGNWEQLDVAKEEKEIIDSLNDFINAEVSDRYMIKETKNNTDNILCVINTLEDYLDYVSKYEEKQVKKLKFTKGE